MVTFWEGELVDNMNHCFYTRSWETDRASDEKFWSKFGGFTELKQQVRGARMELGLGMGAGASVLVPV